MEISITQQQFYINIQIFYILGKFYYLHYTAMKYIITSLLFSVCAISMYSQVSDNPAKEKTLLRLEKEWTEVLDRNDTIALKNYWTEDYVVNNATGKIVTANQILSLLKTGHKFPKVDRNVERIIFNADLAVVMGGEIEYSDDGTQKNRRFTNIWRETPQGWKLVARQATGN